jgi:hypothetical protein
MSDTLSHYDRSSQSMDSSEITAGRATIGAGKLVTPVEPLLHSFSQEKNTQELKGLPHTLSPPTSPDYRLLPSFTSAGTQSPHADDPLFPEHAEDVAQRPEAPLFDSQNTDIEHPSAPSSPQQEYRPTTPATLRVPGTTISIKNERQAAIDYFDSCMAELANIRIAQHSTLPPPHRSTVAARDPETTRQLQALTRPAGVVKTRSPVKIPARPRQPRVTPAPSESPEKAARTHRARTPRTQTDFFDSAFPEKKHKRAPPTKTTASKESDLHWREMTDYSPPIETLAAATSALAKGTEWNHGNGLLDISNEQDFAELHPDEVALSKTLRLKPVQYLSNKRRIFEAKVSHLRDNKTFTKTAAQNATNIDVNKASQLWLAFDRVGWFKTEHFERFLTGS